MLYPFISVGLIVVFIICLLYILFVKRDFEGQKNNILVGLFFLVIWGIIYYYLLV
ncbi:hypothetical protein HMPREF9714_02209 [Myroides odoratimimus CCUG 12901]|uniref:Cardiolipin synthase N-terminal domain-containing protein n=1 Tax=Myroides odoratimimus CCUG 10230 TaxID=883150 RepID=A0ABP2NBY3_9FLAO|nr:hypothetical protein HMPREF9714_02209 [Myroides odoratimimus CCUG 12901]EHO10242.1 hypothetical protein HMPREF9712_01347 [Myroides odoratimimus CCUG 10230]STZ48923.1 Uncharacterised protein [Myroides odoratimimus]